MKLMIGEYTLNTIKWIMVKLFNWIILGIINNSYWILLFCCIFSLILYIAGLKKAGKYVPITFILFCFFQAIKGLVV